VLAASPNIGQSCRWQHGVPEMTTRAEACAGPLGPGATPIGVDFRPVWGRRLPPRGSYASRVGEIQRDPDPDEGPWVTVQDAARFAGVSVSTVRRWQRDDRIRSRQEPNQDKGHRVFLLQDVLGQKARSSGKPAGSVIDLTSDLDEFPEVVPVPRRVWEKTLEEAAGFRELAQELALATQRAVAAELENERLRKQAEANRVVTTGPAPARAAETPIADFLRERLERAEAELNRLKEASVDGPMEGSDAPRFRWPWKRHEPQRP
jgi:DNA-binding transcriptional MerR regulator